MNGSMTGNIVVQLMGGTYRLSSTFTLGPQDSGSNGYTVDWEAYPGQTPVIDGSEQVTGWSQYDSGRNIWRAAVPTGTQARDLWVNGVRATETQSAISPGGGSPSQGFKESGRHLEACTTPGGTRSSSSNKPVTCE